MRKWNDGTKCTKKKKKDNVTSNQVNERNELCVCVSVKLIECYENCFDRLANNDGFTKISRYM